MLDPELFINPAGQNPERSDLQPGRDVTAYRLQLTPKRSRRGRSGQLPQPGLLHPGAYFSPANIATARPSRTARAPSRPASSFRISTGSRRHSSIFSPAPGRWGPLFATTLTTRHQRRPVNEVTFGLNWFSPNLKFQWNYDPPPRIRGETATETTMVSASAL